MHGPLSIGAAIADTFKHSMADTRLSGRFICRPTETPWNDMAHKKEETPTAQSQRYLLGDGTFRFACHSGVACFTRCCHNADMYLYPYDILRLKQRLGLTSDAFLLAHTLTALRDMPTFPSVMLKMSEAPGKPCTFLTDQGCSVYEDRPYACRCYPLEPALYGDEAGNVGFRYYVMRHGHCLGHREGRQWHAQAWMDDQQMADYTEINSLWAPIAARLQSGDAGPQGADSPAMKMTFMASYNMDTFRRFVFESSFGTRFQIPEQRLSAAREDEVELLRLGLEWINSFLFGMGPMQAMKAQT